MMCNTKLFIKKYSYLILTFTIVIILSMCVYSKSTDKVVVTDINKWNNPVQKVFKKYPNMYVKKIVLYKNKPYMVFYLDGAADIMEDYRFYKEIAEANSYCNFRLVDDYLNSTINVICQKSTKRVIKAIVQDKSNKKKSYEMNFKIVGTRSKIGRNELSVIYNGIILNEDTNVYSMWKRLGTGTATENNNYGYYNTGSDGHIRYSYGYPEKNAAIYIHVVDKATNPKIERIILANMATKKGVKSGDKYEKIIQLYGKPNFEIKYCSNSLIKALDSTLVYTLENKQLIFNVDESKKVFNVYIEYKNLYKY